ncbi:MAG: NADH-quinone oxidoreductase subunit M [Dehalococcoidia bacterium]|nr:NADH-quinone oxidoreductase subunit M [Dehalococcoidia bacterium]
MLFPSDRPKLVPWFVVVLTTLTLGLSAYTFLAYDRDAAGFQFTNSFRWLPSLGASLDLGVDGISAPMVLLTGVVAFTGTLVSWKTSSNAKNFFVLLLLLVSGVYGTFVALDLLFFFFFYELAVLPMYLLIGVWGSSTDFKTFLRTKEYGALKLTLYLVAGSVLIWVALLAMWVEGGDLLGRLTFGMVDLQGVGYSEDFQKLFYPLLMVGFGVLAGMWPFHTWSPDGHVAAPTAVSMLHAGVLMKLGAYGILRIGMQMLPEGADAWAPVLIGLGAVNVIYGAVSAMAQRDLKYVVGYSSVSHMGYVLMGLGTIEVIGVSGATLQMFSHGIMTALFFVIVGMIYDRAHVRDIGVFEGIAKRMPFAAAIFAIAGLASLGLPGLSGFVAEFMVFVGAFRTYPVLGGLAVVGAALTAVYILRLIAKAFFGPLDPRWQTLTDATRLEMAAAAILVGFLFLWGLYPWYITSVINSSVTPLVRAMTGG